MLIVWSPGPVHPRRPLNNRCHCFYSIQHDTPLTEPGQANWLFDSCPSTVIQSLSKKQSCSPLDLVPTGRFYTLLGTKGARALCENYSKLVRSRGWLESRPKLFAIIMKLACSPNRSVQRAAIVSMPHDISSVCNVFAAYVFLASRSSVFVNC